MMQIIQMMQSFKTKVYQKTNCRSQDSLHALLLDHIRAAHKYAVDNPHSLQHQCRPKVAPQ